MGWASGSQLADEVWGIVREFVPHHKRRTIAREIIDVFENEDADAWDENDLICEDAGYPILEDDELEEDEQ